MLGDTLFDHTQDETGSTPENPDQRTNPIPAPTCKTIRDPEKKDPAAAEVQICRCSVERPIPERNDRELPCAFADWVERTATELAKSAPKDRDISRYINGAELTPERPLEFLLSIKALGPNYDSTTLAFPGFYAFYDTPSDQGVILLSTLYSKAIDLAGDLGIDHRAGYRREPGECIVGRYFAAGFKERDESKAELAYSENHIDLRNLVCRDQEDLEALYLKILQSKLDGAKETS